MQKILKSIATIVAAITIAAPVLADEPRKEAILDTGKGGFKLLVSVPSFAQGPYDFAKNKGPVVTQGEWLSNGQVMYNAPLSDTSVVVYQAATMRRIKHQKGETPITAEHLASEMLREEGFKMDRATKIDCPKVPVEGGKIACYKASGFSIFDGKEKKTSIRSIVVVGVSWANDTQGYAMIATIAEKDFAAFDKEPEKYEKLAKGAVGGMLKNQQLQLN